MNNSLNLMQWRLNFRGGVNQHDRMIKDKKETLDRVLLYSYQGADVRKLGSETGARALINPNSTKQDYDDKTISIGYEYDFKPGTIFEWENTGTKWLVYLQDLTELAYFRGDIRKCSYQISWKGIDDKGKEIVLTTYAAVRGPIETNIDSTQTSSLSYDMPNHTLNLLLPASKEILKNFKRYSKFYIQPLKDGDSPVCWKIEATDTISMPGILQITAIEHYSNEQTDNIEKGIVDAYVEEIKPEQETTIQGETYFIKPKKPYTYTYEGDIEGSWYFDPRLPIVAQPNGKEITITWNKTYTGQFVLSYGNEGENNKDRQTIVVESLY